jgi:DNA-directed RNA polymerase specialized sigma24 family protein
MTEDRPKITEAEQKSFIGLANIAAAAKDPLGMLAALHKSFALDGLHNRLVRKWGRTLSLPDVEFCLTSALDSLYAEVSSGKGVAQTLAFLWRVADRRALDRHSEKKLESAFLDRNDSGYSEPELTGGLLVEERVSGEDSYQVDEKAAKAHAISIARGLLPRIGLATVQTVMTHVLNEIEKGCEDLSCSEVAESLGLSPNVVSQSIKRGFERLAREARKDNLLNQLGPIQSMEPDEPEEQ